MGGGETQGSESKWVVYENNAECEIDIKPGEEKQKIQIERTQQQN